MRHAAAPLGAWFLGLAIGIAVVASGILAVLAWTAMSAGGPGG